MKKPNVKKLICSLILCAFQISCSSIPKPPDVPVCKHQAQRVWTNPDDGRLYVKPSPVCMKEVGEPECGVCATIVTGKTFYVGEASVHHFNAKPWSQLRRESILVPSVESYAPLSTYIINSCKKLKCSDEVTRFKVKVDAVSGEAREAVKAPNPVQEGP